MKTLMESQNFWKILISEIFYALWAIDLFSIAYDPLTDI